MFIDTHTHLFFDNFKDDLDKVITSAKEAGVTKMIIPATDLATARNAIKLTEQYPELYAAIGVHPHDCKDYESEQRQTLIELAQHPKVVAIGEIGLDYFYDFTPKAKQIEAFRDQLELALELDLPAVIHNRDSNQDMLTIIREFSSRGLRAQFHCFNADLPFAQEVIELGHIISFTGNITHKKADKLRALVAQISLHKIMLETDSPFMTPVPHRGHRNEPKYIPLIASTIADLHKTTIENVGLVTTNTARRFFGLDAESSLVLTYKLGESLYINVTNRCNADCVFCARSDDPILSGYNLKMKKSEELSAQHYINDIGDPLRYKEIVFCGYGEPTIRWELVKEIARYVKSNGGATRLNTNGHGNLINHRDITPEMTELLDVVSISLNTHIPEQYAKIMRVPIHYFYEMLDFAKRAKAHCKVVLSVVDYPEVDLKAAEVIANEIGVEFRVRAYF